MASSKGNIESTKLYSWISFFVLWIDTIVKNYIRVKATLDAIVFVAQEQPAAQTKRQPQSAMRRSSYNYTSPSLVDQLPLVVLRRIFDNLGNPALLECMVVCKRWHRLVTPILWTHPTFDRPNLQFSPTPSQSYTKQELHQRRRCISTANQPRPDQSVSSPLLPRQPQQRRRRYQSNNLGGDRPTTVRRRSVPDALAVLAKPDYGDAVQSLSLEPLSGQLTDDLLLFVLQNCPRLTSLNLTHCNRITSQGFHHLAHAPCAPYLVQLTLAGCATLEDHDLITLSASCHRLEKINVSGCSRITEDGVRALVSAARHYLRYINMRDCLRVSGHVLQDLAVLCGNHLLGVDATRICSIVHADIQALVHHCPQLEQLYVGRSRSPLVCQLQHRMRQDQATPKERKQRPVSTSMLNKPEALASLVQVIQQRERKQRLRNLSQPTASPFTKPRDDDQQQDVSQATVELIIRHLTRLKAIDLSHWSCLTDQLVRRLWQHGRLQHVGLEGDTGPVALFP
ncbi:RNI-like protein [Hesseltinella vesiculosa]|uniref:RNI-like protein n=1 Tax=Hesseltinella vesiculosa TaxID=101127 RepID=A0A1X2GR78_9FUNG|nr:RNI-like protein [Hesseltinella vesiculosa]